MRPRIDARVADVLLEERSHFVRLKEMEKESKSADGRCSSASAQTPLMCCLVDDWHQHPALNAGYAGHEFYVSKEARTIGNEEEEQRGGGGGGVPCILEILQFF